MSEYTPKPEETHTMYWCAHCGMQSEDRSEIQNHCQELGHRGVVQSPAYDEIDNHADDAAVQRLTDRMETLSEYQLQRLSMAVENERNRRY